MSPMGKFTLYRNFLIYGKTAKFDFNLRRRYRKICLFGAS
ncbi:hypothetical protein CAMRE0001_2894 [Campylobacter rectus RM3267]|uniref:Uncharacterized protein n=1 Tax=Campylobacter rectus RM3267 TaxID=553218 RepID=B9D260_CAMRE|nr:hypothetical protein CAMRE0001_2894 [Campylobacter rectus RM3267]